MAQVCIVGGGYGGLAVARGLRGRLRAGWSITLVDRGDAHQLLTRLPEIVAGTIEAHEACVPFKRVLGPDVRHLQAEVLGVDIAGRQVQTSAGSLDPDWLVLALGSVADHLGVPGAAEHAMTLKSVGDAVRIRDRVRGLHATGSAPRVVVVGAGYTGSEVAGELTASEPALRVTVVAADERLLPQGNPRLSLAVEHTLRARGIPLLLGHPVARVLPDSVELASGESLPADLVIWAAHTVAAPAAGVPAQGLGKDGRLPVDPYLRTAASERVFACGDLAFVYDFGRGTAVPSSAQLAIQEGDTVGWNLSAAVEGRELKEFRPHPIGEAIALGGKDAAAEVGGVVLTGRPARAVKRAALLRYLARIGVPFSA